MQEPVERILFHSVMFRRLAPEDRQRLTDVTLLRVFEKGEPLFSEGDPSDFLYIVVAGRVKVVKTTLRGTDVILEIFGSGDPVGAVAVYESRPYPASAVALEPTSCLLVPRAAFLFLLETYPTFVRGLLVGLTRRLVELTNRLADLSGSRVEARLARFFLKLSNGLGQPRADGVFIPIALSRQELGDMIGATLETSIRIMSRWARQNIVRTERGGFIVVDRPALEGLAAS